MGVYVRLIRIGIFLAVGINFAFIFNPRVSDHNDMHNFFGEAPNIVKQEHTTATSKVALQGLGSNRAVSKALQISRVYSECQGKERFLSVLQFPLTIPRKSVLRSPFGQRRLNSTEIGPS